MVVLVGCAHLAACFEAIWDIERSQSGESSSAQFLVLINSSTLLCHFRWGLRKSVRLERIVIDRAGASGI